MRIKTFAFAVSALALSAGAALAQNAFTDAELASFAGAMTRMQAVAQAVAGGTPSAEQQAEMAAAVQESGLTIERFNAISTAVSADETLQARVAVVSAPASPAGSVGAGVTDAELASFAGAMTRMQAVAQAVAGGTPSAEQQAEMAAAVQESGLTIERFNAISTAAPSDPALKARIDLAMVQAGQ